MLTSFEGSVSIAIQEALIQLGDGTADWDYPMATYYHDARTQVIYLDSEIGGSGSITSLALNVISAPGQSMEDWTIRMRHTALDSYSGSPEWESDWVVVHQSTTTVSSTGWMTFGFDTPFEYNGTNNLMVDLSFNNTSYSSDGSCESTDTGVSRSLYYQTDSDYGDPLDWTGSSSPSPDTSYNIPNITLGFLAGEPVPISPTNTGAFVSGVWSGTVTVLEAASNMVLRADDGLGHTGSTPPFNVLASAVDDLDADGIPNDWETLYYGGSTNANSSAICSNGINTVLQAYIAGLNPTNATSRLMLNPLPDNALYWSAISGRVYSIWWTTNLLENFQPLETNLPWTQGSYTNSNPSPCDYYKIKVELE